MIDDKGMMYDNDRRKSDGGMGERRMNLYNQRSDERWTSIRQTSMMSYERLTNNNQIL